MRVEQYNGLEVNVTEKRMIIKDSFGQAIQVSTENGALDLLVIVQRGLHAVGKSRPAYVFFLFGVIVGLISSAVLPWYILLVFAIGLCAWELLDKQPKS